MSTQNSPIDILKQIAMGMFAPNPYDYKRTFDASRTPHVLVWRDKDMNEITRSKVYPTREDALSLFNSAGEYGDKFMQRLRATGVAPDPSGTMVYLESEKYRDIAKK